MKVASVAIAALLAANANVFAENVVGYNVVTVPANADALVSVPFCQRAAMETTVSSVTATGITVAETLVADEYVSAYYIRLTSGAGKGLWSTISANGTSGFEVENADVLDYVNAGDSFEVCPHQTLETAFPASLAGSSFTTDTQVIILDAAAGINKGGTIYSFVAGGLLGNAPGWYNGINYAGEAVITPGSYVVLRNQGSEEFYNVVMGNVSSVPVAELFPATSQLDDISLGLYPVDKTLNELGVEGAGQLVVIDNQADGINKGGKVYSFVADGLLGNPAGWYDGIAYAGEVVVPAGTGVILRRPANAEAFKLTTSL